MTNRYQAALEAGVVVAGHRMGPQQIDLEVRKEHLTMPRRKTPSQESKLRQGRGKGHGKDYTPYLTVRDVPSLGLAQRILGQKTGRIHHVLSLLESRFLYVLLWSLSVVDIREQYPLPLDETLEIAQRLGIPHPLHPKTKMPVVMTTDVLIDELTNGVIIQKARSLKYVKDLGKKRVIQKHEIERTFWAERNVDWGITTERDIPVNLVARIKWVYDAVDPRYAPKIPPTTILQIESALYELLMGKARDSLAHYALRVDRMYDLKPGTSLWVVRLLIAHRCWIVDMNLPLATDEPLIVISRRRPSLDGEAQV